MPSSGLLVGLTKQLRIEPTPSQLELRLSPAMKGAINLRFAVTTRVTMRMHIMGRGHLILLCHYVII